MQVGPLLRREIAATPCPATRVSCSATSAGTPPSRRSTSLADCGLPVRVYGLGEREAVGSVSFHAIDERRFVDDLAALPRAGLGRRQPAHRRGAPSRQADAPAAGAGPCRAAHEQPLPRRRWAAVISALLEQVTAAIVSARSSPDSTTFAPRSPRWRAGWMAPTTCCGSSTTGSRSVLRGAGLTRRTPRQRPRTSAGISPQRPAAVADQRLHDRRRVRRRCGGIPARRTAGRSRSPRAPAGSVAIRPPQLPSDAATIRPVRIGERRMAGVVGGRGRGRLVREPLEEQGVVRASMRPRSAPRRSGEPGRIDAGRTAERRHHEAAVFGEHPARRGPRACCVALSAAFSAKVPPVSSTSTAPVSRRATAADAVRLEQLDEFAELAVFVVPSTSMTRCRVGRAAAALTASPRAAGARRSASAARRAGCRRTPGAASARGRVPPDRGRAPATIRAISGCGALPPVGPAARRAGRCCRRRRCSTRGRGTPRPASRSGAAPRVSRWALSAASTSRLSWWMPRIWGSFHPLPLSPR